MIVGRKNQFESMNNKLSYTLKPIKSVMHIQYPLYRLTQLFSNLNGSTRNGDRPKDVLSLTTSTCQIKYTKS